MDPLIVDIATVIGVVAAVAVVFMEIKKSKSSAIKRPNLTFEFVKFGRKNSDDCDVYDLSFLISENAGIVIDLISVNVIVMLFSDDHLLAWGVNQKEYQCVLKPVDNGYGGALKFQKSKFNYVDDIAHFNRITVLLRTLYKYRKRIGVDDIWADRKGLDAAWWRKQEHILFDLAPDEHKAKAQLALKKAGYK